MNILQYVPLSLVVIIERTFARYLVAYLPRISTFQQFGSTAGYGRTAPSSPFPEWSYPQHDAYPYMTLLAAPRLSFPIHAAPTFMRAPVAAPYFHPGYAYPMYPHPQYYRLGSNAHDTSPAYTTVRQQGMEPATSDDDAELAPSEINDDGRLADSLLFYPELLRTRLYRQLQAMRRSYRLGKALEKMKIS
ncbi:hypothetical protein RB195_001762 [Necator americanus]|uniref:Uncharacterized protein n=1 Tax=Necator americanus TaxID=51031 RepID=A0ABR1DFT2_NECAM